MNPIEERTLHLTLKKVWYDKTDSGEKPEEYREITEYWIRRLVSVTNLQDVEALRKMLEDGTFTLFKTFDKVFARNGYNPKINPSWTRKCLGITIGEGRPEWGAEPGKKYFVIKLGEKL